MIRTGGYTLLELVVVVAVLAMATALVAPSGYRMIGTWREASQVDAALQSVASLPMLARREGHRLELGGEDAARDAPLIVGGRNDNTRMREEAEKASAAAVALLALPEGWDVAFEPALVVQPNGACSDSRGTLRTARQELAFEVQAPFCRIHRLPAGG